MPIGLARKIVGGIALVLCGGVYLQAARPRPAVEAASNLPAARPITQSSNLTTPSAATYRAVLDRYCVTCHNARLRTADLTLDTIDIGQAGRSPEMWEKVVRKLRSASMPPPGRPRPDKTTYDAFASWLETALDRAAGASPEPGRSTVHRLNRAEYTNAIRDLLALEIDGRALLPPDDSARGFDNIADVLSISPGLLERYMSAATKISQLAIGDPALRPVVQTYSVRPTLVQDDRMSEDLSFGTRGGLAVRHHFPLDGEYVLKIRLQRTWMDEIRGLAEPHQLEVRLDRALIQLFTVGGKLKARSPDGQVQQGQDRQRSEDVQQQKQYEMTADAGLEVRFPAKAGSRLVGVAFQKDLLAPEGVLRPRPSVVTFSYRGLKDIDPAVDSIQVSGPYNAKTPEDTPSRRQIFVCRPSSREDEEPCARKILSSLARHAYRRPVTEEDVQTLLGFYRTGRSKKGFEAGVGLALERLLVDPDFLIRIEHDPVAVKPGTPYFISDFDLASRLSFFLWSSVPDEELLNLAAGHRLKDPTVLEQQVRRMIASPRSDALVKNFAGQWLYLRNMRLVLPDPEAFPGFDDNLRDGLQRETELFFESMLRDDRSVPELLSANYTFLNERLARHYQIPNVYGNHFRRVTLTDGRRAGLLGHGSILMVTSYAHRTSPVVRGKWLLENVLGAPPPPPPANVPPLKENEKGGELLSVRDRLEQHRNNPICASCHSRMDPLGFALENFDAIGRWRETSEAGTAIDASGALPDGTTFQGPIEFRNALLKQGDAFVGTVADKLLTYALGRGLEYYDAPAVRKIVREAAANDYRWSALILGVVKSTPFQMKRSREP